VRLALFSVGSIYIYIVSAGTVIASTVCVLVLLRAENASNFSHYFFVPYQLIDINTVEKAVNNILEL